MVDVMNMLLLLLPGVATTYYGEEIGMVNVRISFEDTQDPQGKNAGRELYTLLSRDPCRSPMQWNAGKNAGFSTAEKTWLPVNENIQNCNVQVRLIYNY